MQDEIKKKLLARLKINSDQSEKEHEEDINEEEGFTETQENEVIEKEESELEEEFEEDELEELDVSREKHEDSRESSSVISKVTEIKRKYINESASEKRHEKEVSVSKGLKQIVREVESPEEAEFIDISYMISETMPDAVSDYVIDIAGKPVLTYAGILRAVVEMGNIECSVEPIEISQRRVIFKAKAKHLERNVLVEGIGVVDLDIEEERVRRLKEKYKNDPYRLRNYDEQLARLKEYRIQIAFSRAQRNALRCLINEREWAHRFKKMLITGR